MDRDVITKSLMGRRQENIVGVVIKEASGWSDVRKGPTTAKDTGTFRG